MKLVRVPAAIAGMRREAGATGTEASGGGNYERHRAILSLRACSYAAMRSFGAGVVLLLASALSVPLMAAQALPGCDLSRIYVPPPQARALAGLPRDKAYSDGSDALARIKRSAAYAVRGARPAAELEMNELKTLLAGARNMNPDPGDPRTQRLMDAFMRLYSRFTAAGLAAISSADESEYARGFFSEFFTPEDNQPQEVKTLAGYLSSLARYRVRRDYEYTVGTLTDGGDMAMAKGGEVLVLSGEYAAWQRDEAAAVLAHEMAHNENRHFMQYYIVSSVNDLLLSETGAPEAKTAAGLAENYYKWLCEYQADGAGRELLRRAGFDPAGLAAVLSKLPPSVANLGSDHPTAQLRLQQLSDPSRKYPVNYTCGGNCGTARF